MPHTPSPRVALRLAVDLRSGRRPWRASWVSALEGRASRLRLCSGAGLSLKEAQLPAAPPDRTKKQKSFVTQLKKGATI
jgi:hypothetical protein